MLFVGVDVVGANDTTVGAVRSTVTAAADRTAAGPVFPTVSATAFCASDEITVPSVALAPDSVTVHDKPEPTTEATLHPVDEPDSAKSAAVSPVTDSENVTL